MNNTLELLANAFQYPRPGRKEALQAGLPSMPDGVVKARFARFLEQVSRLSLSAWEELFTDTLDLAPKLPAYVGHAVYGEDYRRGAFMAALNRVYGALGVLLDGELPDHLVPVLRYLATGAAPLPELAENLEPALKKMYQELKSRDPGNPYLALLEATESAVAIALSEARESDADVVALGR